MDCCASPARSPLTAGRPRLRIPAFSVAMAASVLPSCRVWSNEMLVMIESSGWTTLVESSRPPMPTSSTTAPTWRRAKCSRPIAVVISKKVSRHWSRSDSSRSSRSTASRTSSTSAITSSGAAGWPSTVNRSSRRCRCGEEYSPVRTPAADSPAAIIAAVEPFPLVPAMWMIDSPAWGSPSRRSSRRIRPSFSSSGIRGMPSHS